MSPLIPTGRVRAACVLLIACLQYPVAELITASAWRMPPYSFVHNYISDLGSPDCGPLACSPLFRVMNVAFVVSGLLAIGSVLLLAPLLPRAGSGRAAVTLAIVHGFGTIGVGLVPSAPHAAAGTPPLHVIAAVAAIVGGNLALIAIAVAAGASAARWLRTCLAVLGVFGLGSAVLLVADTHLPAGLVERMAADTITPSEVLIGVTLLIALRRHDRRPHQGFSAGDALTSRPETPGSVHG